MTFGSKKTRETRMTQTAAPRLGFVGLGTIATAVATSLARRGHALLVSERSLANSQWLSGEFERVQVANNQAVLDGSQLVFIGTTGAQAPQVLEALSFRSDQKVVSFMADLDIQQVARLVAPAKVEALMIPFPSIAQGGSPILCQPQSAVIEALFGGDNRVFAIGSDQALQAYMSAQAVLSPVVKLLAETQVWLAARLEDAGHGEGGQGNGSQGDGDQGDGDQGGALGGEAFLRQLIGGSLLAEPLDKPGVLAGLLADLSTPGGFNAELRDVLGEAGAYEALRAGLDGLASRFDDA